MSPADGPREPARSPLVAVAQPPTDMFHKIARFLYTQNPFYLLSVALVLHSTRLWYREGVGPFNPWPLMGIIGGYIILVAGVGFVLVRVGKVWDDARSIFLIMLLLFVELSLTFDGVLVSQPATGRALLATGLALAVVVSEGLLIGLRIRLPPLYRIPYHLFLALLFLYPLAVVAGMRGEASAAVWRVYLFSPATAVVLLTLLPAIRRGPQYVAQTGTPWHWPWFPWGLFGFLTICAGLRAYALSLSFDPVLMQKLDEAMRLESAFGLYFLVPILFAVAVLLMEAGIVTRNRRVQTIALAVPFACVVLSMTWRVGSAPYIDFLDRFIVRVGSPLWLSAVAGLVFAAYARLRQVRFASESFWGLLLIAAIIGRTTTDLSNVISPQTWALWFVAIVQGVLGLRTRQSWRVCTAAICGLAAVRTDFLIAAEPLIRDALPLHLAGLAVLGIGALFNDRFSGVLRQAGVPILVTAMIGAVGFHGEYDVRLPQGIVLVYAAVIVATTFAYAYVVGAPAYFYAGLTNLCLLTARLLYELAGVLKRLFDWQGATWFVWGLVWFAVGVLISAWKAGLAGRLARVVPRVPRENTAPPSNSAGR